MFTMLLSARKERFSVSRMQDLFVTIFYFNTVTSQNSTYLQIPKISNTIPPGILAPVYAAAFLVTDTLQNDEERFYGCLVIQICQTFIVVCYFWTIFFSLVFRMVLIRFSERGLVERGKPNLLLFHQLYWTVFGAFSFMTISIFTIMPILQGTCLGPQKT